MKKHIWTILGLAALAIDHFVRSKEMEDMIEEKLKEREEEKAKDAK